jgi:hypothetical protein
MELAGDLTQNVKNSLSNRRAKVLVAKRIVLLIVSAKTLRKLEL